jgi:hypothetical protein
MRVMYDSVTLANCPTDGQLYACYVDGAYANKAEAIRRFPGKRIVLITVTGSTLNAHVADVETGDLSPASGASWAKRRKAAGYFPTLYCNTSTRPAVEAACHAVGLTVGRDVWIWEAHYDGVATLPPNTVAKQYLGDYHGYDKSVVAAYWPGVDPKSTAPTFAYRRPLHLGMAGTDVVSLKRRLRYLGYRGLWLTPYFGRGLDTVVREFQRAHRLTVDGVVGPITAAAINR